jgi:hypothetical protein
VRIHHTPQLSRREGKVLVVTVFGPHVERGELDQEFMVYRMPGERRHAIQYNRRDGFPFLKR